MIRAFMNHQRYRGWAPSTIRRRTETLRQFERFIDPVPLADATPALIEEFLSLRPAPRTRHAYRSDLRVFYAWAVARDLMAVSPADRVASVKVPKSLPRPVSRQDAIPLLFHGSLSVRRMVALAMHAGLRCGEIANLRAEDINLHSAPGVIVVRNGKGGKDRSVPVHPVLAELLAGIASSGPVFPGQAADTLRPDTVSRQISLHLRRSGLVAKPHHLRHSFGTELARESGGDMVLTSTLMGHETMTTTLGYVRLAHSAGADIVARMYGPDAA